MAPTIPYPVTAVQDRLDLDLDALKELLEIEGDDENTRLQVWLDAAKEAADEYMGNPFWRRDPECGYRYFDPVQEMAIPNTVKLGVVEYVKAMRERPGFRVVEEKTRHVSVKYAQGRDDLMEEVGGTWWRRWRLITIG